MGEGGIKNGQKIPTAPYCAEFSSQIFFHAASQKPIILLASKSDCFTCLNSGINIFIYGMLDVRFRNVFKTLFCKRCTDENTKFVGSTVATVATATRNIKMSFNN